MIQPSDLLQTLVDLRRIEAAAAAMAEDLRAIIDGRRPERRAADWLTEIEQAAAADSRRETQRPTRPADLRAKHGRRPRIPAAEAAAAQDLRVVGSFDVREVQNEQGPQVRTTINGQTTDAPAAATPNPEAQAANAEPTPPALNKPAAETLAAVRAQVVRGRPVKVRITDPRPVTDPNPRPV